MAKRTTTSRKRSPSRGRKAGSSSGMFTWLSALVVTVAAIAVYDNRAKIFPSEKSTVQFARTQSTPPRNVAVPSSKPNQKNWREGAQTASISKPRDGVLVPPNPIPNVRQRDSATQVNGTVLPQNRPTPTNAGVELAAVGAVSAARDIVPQKQFSFCGQSGLSNCVQDGRIFWRDGKKQVLAGITVARTDDAACVEERRKGFAAKIRLRDFLNAGKFSQSESAGNVSLSRNGASFEQQLLREGLAKPISQKNQSWCS